MAVLVRRSSPIFAGTREGDTSVSPSFVAESTVGPLGIKRRIALRAQMCIGWDRHFSKAPATGPSDAPWAVGLLRASLCGQGRCTPHQGEIARRRGRRPGSGPVRSTCPLGRDPFRPNLPGPGPNTPSDLVRLGCAAEYGPCRNGQLTEDGRNGDRRPDPRSPSGLVWHRALRGRRERFKERAKAGYLAGAEEEWRRWTGRSMTAEELARVVRPYPGDL